jgi:Ca2+-binding EF-hand superfamily protein
MEKEEIEALFDQIDLNKDGNITRNELQKRLRKEGIPVDKAS